VLREQTKGVNTALAKPPLAIKDDSKLVLRDLDAMPVPPRAIELTESLSSAFGPADGKPSLFLSGTGEHVRAMCYDNPILAPGVMTFLMYELANHPNEKLAVYAGELAGRIAESTNNKLGLRRLVVKAYFEREMPLRQSTSFLAALNTAHDVNGLTWVANMHSDDFIGRAAVKMLADHRGITVPVMLQMRERHQGLLAAQGRIWDGMAAIATTQKSLTDQANGLVAARNALADASKGVTAGTEDLKKMQAEFTKQIKTAQDDLRAMEQRLAQLTTELQKALAEAQHYKRQLEQTNAG